MSELKELISSIPRFTSLGLLDCSGGTLAVRTKRGIFVSSLQAAEELNWELTEDDFVLFPGEGDASLARAGRRPSYENRLHRGILHQLERWQFTYHGHPTGLLAFAYARTPLPLSPTHAKRMGLRGGTEIPVVEDPAKGPEYQAEKSLELLQQNFRESLCGAVLLEGDGPVVAASSVRKLVATARLLENAALAQLHLLRG